MKKVITCHDCEENFEGGFIEEKKTKRENSAYKNMIKISIEECSERIKEKCFTNDGEANG